MFTQRNNKAKCFQDCIIEKEKERIEWLEVRVRRWMGGLVLS